MTRLWCQRNRCDGESGSRNLPGKRIYTKGDVSTVSHSIDISAKELLEVEPDEDSDNRAAKFVRLGGCNTLSDLLLVHGLEFIQDQYSMGDYPWDQIGVEICVAEGCQQPRFVVLPTPQSGRGPFAFLKSPRVFIWIRVYTVEILRTVTH